jgi:hypothetical protein
VKRRLRGSVVCHSPENIKWQLHRTRHQEFDPNVLVCRVIAAGFPGGQKKGKKMATKGHRHDGKKIHQQQSKEVMDKELFDIRARMEELKLWM